MSTQEAQSAVLDGLAVLMCLDRGDLTGADAMLRSYHALDDAQTLVNAIVAVALCAVRYAAVTAGTSPDRLLAGVAQEVRAQ